MNLFLPEETIIESVKALDDLRLRKQILECEQMIKVALGVSRGYENHPVVAYYKPYPSFIAKYGVFACKEYKTRFGRHIAQHEFFYNLFCILDNTEDPKPFYCEGSKDSPNAIRTTENTVELFRKKLCVKWDNDKYHPKWTNRQPPIWYIKEI